VGRVDGMSEEVMGNVESDWNERIQRCESGIEIRSVIKTGEAHSELFYTLTVNLLPNSHFRQRSCRFWGANNFKNAIAIWTH